MKTLYQNCANNIEKDNLICQYDKENIASNQCSWFCYTILQKIKENNWIIPNDIKTYYNDALNLASEYRKKNGQVTWGESIFSKIILENIPFNIDEPKCTVLNKGENLLYIESMRNINNYKNSLKKVALSNFLLEISRIYSENKFLIVNRFGQSFLIIPDYKNKQLKIYDSHQRSLGGFNSNGVREYILNNISSYCQIIWVIGHMDNNKIKESILKKLYDPSK